MRDYGTGQWEGGDPDCDHLNPAAQHPQNMDKLGERYSGGGHKASSTGAVVQTYRDVCGKCGANRVDRQLGLEATPDEFVQAMVRVFREVRRVLRRDGTMFLNIGDSYVSGQGGRQSSVGELPPVIRRDRPEPKKRPELENAPSGWAERAVTPRTYPGRETGLKPKDLVGIPWRVAFALQQPYYTGRIAAEQDRVWLAAMIDGEGTICGFRHERPDGNIRTGCLTFITNSSEAILNECDRIWQGSRYTETLKPGDKVLGGVATRPCWRWELQSAADRSALVRELYPYLIEKKRQAMVAWNLLELVQAAKKMGRGGETPAVKEKRDVLVRLLSDLNQKRDVDLPSWLVEPPSLYEPGWYLRSDVIWSKNNPMPESVTDRPTKAHEYVFLLTKQPRYFFDQEAVREAMAPASEGRYAYAFGGAKAEALAEADANGIGVRTRTIGMREATAGRNVRSVWEIATQPYPEAHFATFPEALPERCIKAGTSEKGCCPECGAPWERIVETGPSSWEARKAAGHKTSGYHAEDGALASFQNPDLSQAPEGAVQGGLGWVAPRETVGWRRTCEHDWQLAIVPCTVLDPFMGSGTTALVARRLGRRSIGIELNPEYAQLAARRLQQLSLLAEGAA